MKQHSIWNEKYRPNDLTTFIGNEQLKNIISQYIDKNDPINMLFYGPPGCGKTTLSKLIVNNLDCDFMYINASDERGIDTIRDKVSGFASAASFKPLKVIILDEADFITIQGQAALRNVIETYSRTTRFILTCNYVERIIDPLQSRCQVLKIVPPSKQDIAKHISGILEKEEVLHTIEDIKLLVNQFYPDLRKMLNTAQLSNKDGELKIDKHNKSITNFITGVTKYGVLGEEFFQVNERDWFWVFWYC